MNESLRIILAFTSALPAITAIILYRKINKQYYPFVYILILALLTEIGSLVTHQSTSSLNVNIFILLNTALHLWFFYNMRILKNKSTAIGIMIFFVVVIAGNGIYNTSVHIFFSVAAIVSSVTILILCIEGITKKVFLGNETWYKDGFFMFCLTSIIYYIYFTFIFTLRFFGLEGKETVVKFITSAHDDINAITNILFTWVILCIAQIKKYIKS